MFRCEHCGRHWWAKRLEQGPVRPQLAEMYGDDEGASVEWLVDEVMIAFGLPEFMAAPAYWQVIVSGDQWSNYVERGELSFRRRTRIFLKSIATLFRNAS